MASTTQDGPSTTTPSTTTATTSSNVINIGTRRSKLAMIQAEMVVEMLKESDPKYEYNITAISTMGDKNQVTALHDFGAKSLWTFELETMLLNGEVDLIVHCLKDIPTQIPPTCIISTILRREDPRDALILSPRLPASTTLSSLPPNSIIGTSSVRRSAQLARIYPHLRFQSVRGNVGTRLGKLDADDSPFAAIVLAAAGLIRLGLADRISTFLSSKNVEGAQDHEKTEQAPPAPHEQAKAQMEAEQISEGKNPRWGMLHAVGQGALAIETRVGDSRIETLLAPLHDKETALATLAERSLLRTLEGGCSVPIGVETSWGDADGGEVDLTMKAIVCSVDGVQAVTGSLTRKIETEAESDEFGWEMARLLLDRGAGPILKAINLNRDILEHQSGNA